jgi:hypothetical protein
METQGKLGEVAMHSASDNLGHRLKSAADKFNSLTTLRGVDRTAGAGWPACDRRNAADSPKYPWCLTHAVIRPIFEPSMGAVSETHTNFGTQFPRQKLMPYLRFLVATSVAPPAAIRYAKNPTFVEIASSKHGKGGGRLLSHRHLVIYLANMPLIRQTQFSEVTTKEMHVLATRHARTGSRYQQPAYRRFNGRQPT